MDSLWLTFRNPETEREYSERIVRDVLRHSDITFLAAFFFIAVTVAVRVMPAPFSLDPRRYASMTVALSTAVYVLWELGVRKRMSADEIARRRTQRVFVSRTVLVMFHCLLEHSGGEVLNCNAWFMLFVRTGIVMNVFLSFYLRLNMRTHIPIHAAATVFMLLCSRATCTAVMNTKESAIVEWVADWLNQASEYIVTVMYARFGIRVAHWPLLCPCLHFTFCLHVVVLSIGGSYLLWMMERNSRLAFIGDLPDERKIAEHLLDVSRFPTCIVAQHIVLLVIAFAIIWKLDHLVICMLNTNDWFLK